MKNKTIRIIILILLLTGLGGYLFTQRHEFMAQLGTLEKQHPPPARTIIFDTPYQDEAGWIIQSILTDIYGMIAYQAQAGVVDYDGLAIRIDRVYIDGNFVYKIRADLPQLDEPVELALNFAANDRHIWSPEYYWDWTRMLIDLMIPELPARFSDPADYFPIYRHLLDPRSVVIERENRNLSRILANDMLDPAGNDAAAFLLGVLALRETAGMFSDSRPSLNRMTAHLALANALAPMGSESVMGPMALIIQDVIVNLQTSALEKLAQFEALHGKGPYGSIHRAWCDALRTRATGDWRILKNRADLSLLEKIELFRAINNAISPARALAWVREEESHQIPFNEAARIVAEHRFGVDVGHVFMKNSVAAELQELTTILENPAAELANQNLLIGYLNQQDKMAVSDSHSGGTAVKVIPDGLWAGFFQRHFMHRMKNEYYFYKKVLGVRDQADAFMDGVDQHFVGLRTYPFLASSLARSPAVYEAALRRLRALMRASPELVTRRWWLMPPRPPGKPQDLSDLSQKFLAFHGHVAPGTLYGLKTHSLDGYPANDHHRRLVQRILSQAPYHMKYISRCASKMKNASRLTEEKSLQLYAPLKEFSAPALFKMAKWYRKSGPTEKYIEVYRRLCSLEPAYYFSLGDYLVKIERKSEAAEAYQQGWDQSTSAVLAANNCRWLVNYYFEKGENAKALNIARRAAKTYSYGGLWALADLLEKTEDLKGAEAYYQKIRKRYHDPGLLVRFYRRNSTKALYRKKGDQLMQTLFPATMKKVTLGEFDGRPPFGVCFQTTNNTMRRHGLRAGDVIVAMDGYQVENRDQYRALVNYRDDPVFTVIVWRQNRYEEIKAEREDRCFNYQVETYSGA